MYCVALDPGATTGVCYVRDEARPWDLEVLQLGPDPHHRDLLQLLNVTKPEIIVCESFENRSQDAVVLASVEYIGVVKLYRQMRLGRLLLQSASIGKTFWTDSSLRRHNVYVPTLKHARDACRHYLYFQTFTMRNKDLLSGVASGRAMAVNAIPVGN
jgi:hypothetical protein